MLRTCLRLFRATPALGVTAASSRSAASAASHASHAASAAASVAAHKLPSAPSVSAANLVSHDTREQTDEYVLPPSDSASAAAASSAAVALDLELDQRHFRFPNIIFKMLRNRRMSQTNIDKRNRAPVGPDSSRRNTRGRPNRVPLASHELDPYLVTFKVPLNLNKIQIRNYLEEIYKVRIVSVHTAIFLGKTTNVRGVPKQKSDWKKAYVRLAEPFTYPTLDEQRHMGKPKKPTDIAD